MKKQPNTIDVKRLALILALGAAMLSLVALTTTTSPQTTTPTPYQEKTHPLATNLW